MIALVGFIALWPAGRWLMGLGVFALSALSLSWGVAALGLGLLIERQRAQLRSKNRDAAWRRVVPQYLESVLYLLPSSGHPKQAFVQAVDWVDAPGPAAALRSWVAQDFSDWPLTAPHAHPLLESVALDVSNIQRQGKGLTPWLKQLLDEHHRQHIQRIQSRAASLGAKLVLPLILGALPQAFLLIGFVTLNSGEGP